MNTIRNRCVRGHDLLAHHAFYVDNKGHRRCRRCQLEKVAANDHIRRMRGRQPQPGALEPHKYRTWAREAWAGMSAADRALVSYALIGLQELGAGRAGA